MKRSRRRPVPLPILLSILGGWVMFAAGTVVQKMERPPITSNQVGPRGSGSFTIYNPRTVSQLADANAIPFSVPQSGDVGPKVSEYYKNVRVLTDLNEGEFTRLMINMTTWVSPESGCGGCHNTADFSEDSKYQKVVARRMLQMVRHINSDWTVHVAQTGVTCYTCHRGQFVPPNVWFNNPGPAQAGGLAQVPAGKNHPSTAAAGSALPIDPFSTFLEEPGDVRVQGKTALAGENRHSIKQAEWTYSLMLSISQALGVNCNYCHFTRSFGDWAQSPPRRVKAWYGIRMVRDLNGNYLKPLHDTFPAARLGAAASDSPKVNCATCHNGVFKPLYGVSMIQGDHGFGELKKAAQTE